MYNCHGEKNPLKLACLLPKLRCFPKANQEVSVPECQECAGLLEK